MESSDRKRLFETTEELIKEKIKYFKKVALRKLESGGKHTDDPQNTLSGKKLRDSRNHMHNSTSALTVNPHKSTNKDKSSLLSPKDIKRL